MNTAVSVLFVVAALFATPALFVCCVVLVVKVGRLVVRDDPPRPSPSRPAPAVATEPEAAALAAWRYRQLLELELEPVTAAGAALAAVDVASVRALVDDGCPADLALSIVARETDV